MENQSAANNSTSTYPNVAEGSPFRASDLQIAKLSGTSFSMTHKMGLIGVVMTPHDVYNTLYYDGNTYTDDNGKPKWTVNITKSSTTKVEWNGSTTFTGSDTHRPFVSGTTCYQIVTSNSTPSYSTTTDETNKKYAWSQSCTAISTAGKYEGYSVDYNVDFINACWEFSYSGNGQKWVAPKAGIYSFECWGASGGAASESSDAGVNTPGRGAYTYGRTTLAVSNTFYVFVGGVGVVYSSSSSNGGGGWNGGGAASPATATNQYNIGGGGATDIRLEGNTNSTWHNDYHLRTRVMVAAGGGGLERYTVYTTIGGYAGGLTGGQGYGTYYSNYTTYPNTGASQTGTGNYYVGGPGYFGYANINDNNNSSWGGGGGSGYWGGIRGYGQGGSGGSSYISGHAGCVAIKNSSGSAPSTAGSANSVERSKHYSGRYFTSTQMVDGAGKAWTTSQASTATGMPNPTGSGTENGHLGNGFARITYMPN